MDQLLGVKSEIRKLTCLGDIERGEKLLLGVDYTLFEELIREGSLRINASSYSEDLVLLYGIGEQEHIEPAVDLALRDSRYLTLASGFGDVLSQMAEGKYNSLSVDINILESVVKGFMDILETAGVEELILKNHLMRVGYGIPGLARIFAKRGVALSDIGDTSEIETNADRLWERMGKYNDLLESDPRLGLVKQAFKGPMALYSTLFQNFQSTRQVVMEFGVGSSLNPSPADYIGCPTYQVGLDSILKFEEVEAVYVTDEGAFLLGLPSE